MNENKGCNLCGSIDFETVYRRENIEIITKKESFFMDINNVICKNCGLIFQNPIMDREKLISFYENQYRHTVTDERGGNVRNEQKNYLEKYLNGRKGSILDIGSFEGYYLKLYKEEGWETEGVEPSKEAAEISMKKNGIKVYDDMFENIDFKGKKFDVISIRHVLEHVDNPLITLELIKKHLKDDGILFLEVPDISRFDFYNIADAFDFQHIYNFSQNTMKNYLKKTGFEIIGFDNNLKYAGMRFVCKKGEKKEIENDFSDNLLIVLNYKNKRDENLNFMKKMLEEKRKEWEKENKKIYIYGAGFHTAQLFQEVINKEMFNIKGLFDMSKDKDGKEFFGYRCHSAEKIKEYNPDVILISSYAFQNEIYEYLKKYEEKGVEIVKLYRNTYSYDTI